MACTTSRHMEHGAGLHPTPAPIRHRECEERELAARAGTGAAALADMMTESSQPRAGALRPRPRLGQHLRSGAQLLIKRSFSESSATSSHMSYPSHHLKTPLPSAASAASYQPDRSCNSLRRLARRCGRTRSLLPAMGVLTRKRAAGTVEEPAPHSSAKRSRTAQAPPAAASPSEGSPQGRREAGSPAPNQAKQSELIALKKGGLAA